MSGGGEPSDWRTWRLQEARRIASTTATAVERRRRQRDRIAEAAVADDLVTARRIEYAEAHIRTAEIDCGLALGRLAEAEEALLGEQTAAPGRARAAA